MDHNTVKTLIQGFSLADPAISKRAQAQAPEMLALLLIIGSVARIDLGFTQAIALELSVQDQIQQVIKVCVGNLSLWQLARLVECDEDPKQEESNG